MLRRAYHAHTSITFKIRQNKLLLTRFWWVLSGPDEIFKINDVQGNLSNQLQVTIYDPVHDFVRATLEKRYGFLNCYYKSSHKVLQFCWVFKQKTMQCICRDMESKWQGMFLPFEFQQVFPYQHCRLQRNLCYHGFFPEKVRILSFLQFCVNIEAGINEYVLQHPIAINDSHFLDRICLQSVFRRSCL